MEGAHKLHVKLMQKANTQPELHRPKFGVAARLAGLAITTALILSPLNFAMGQDNKTDAATQKKKAEEKAPPQIIAARLDTTLDKKGAIPSQTKAIAEDKTPFLLALNLEKGTELALTTSDKKEIKLASTKPTALLAQNTAIAKPVQYEINDADIANLPTVSLADMNDLLVKTQSYEGIREIYTIKTDGRDFCYEHIKIPVPGQNWGVVPILGIGTNENNVYDKGLAIRYLDKNRQETGAGYELNGFGAVYKHMTGREFKWAKLIGEPVQDPKEGTYVNVYVVPLSGPYAPIERGSIVLAISYADGQLDKPALFVIK